MDITQYTISGEDRIGDIQHSNGVWLAITGEGSIFSGTESLLRSTDGVSWASTGVTFNPRENSGLAPLGNGTWIIYKNDGRSGETVVPSYKYSTDNGITWSPSWISLSGFADAEMYAAAHNSNTFAVYIVPVFAGTPGLYLLDLPTGNTSLLQELPDAPLFVHARERPAPSYFIIDTDEIFGGSSGSWGYSASQNRFVVVQYNGFDNNSKELWTSLDNVAYTLTKTILDSEVQLAGPPEFDPDQGVMTRFAYDAARATWVAIYSYTVDTATMQKGVTVLAADENFQSVATYQITLPYIGANISNLTLVNDTWYFWGGANYYFTMPAFSVAASAFWTNFVHTREVCT